MQEDPKKPGAFFTWIQKIKAIVKKPFVFSTKKKDETEAEETRKETVQEKEIRETQEKFRKFFDEFKSQTSLNVDADKLTNAINNFQYYETILFDGRGYDDGTKSIRDRKIELSAKARASFIFEHTTSVLTGKIDGLQTEFNYLDERINNKKTEIENEQTFNSAINTLDKNEHRSFSLPLAIFYIIAGIAIMFADFPISLGIAKYFIDLPLSHVDTFRNNIKTPEILLFSLGITLLSVYFKIFYDEYINKSIIIDKSRQTEEPAIISFTFILRVIFKLFVLILLIILLYNIGNVRNSLSALSIITPYKDFVSTKDIFDFRLISFIGTTILLPLLSGICLSVGFGILSNVNNLKKSNNTLELLHTGKQAYEAQKKDCEMVKHMLETLKKEWDKKPEKVDHLKELFVNAYNQGFKRGHRAKFGYDLYENVNSFFIDAITN